MVVADPVIAKFEANTQAIRLRRRGLPYASISITIAEYHGIDRDAGHWRYVCRKAGEPPRRGGKRDAAKWARPA